MLPHRSNGFALVIALSLMALLLLLLVSLSAFVRIEMRMANIQAETLSALQNAWPGAMVALGDCRLKNTDLGVSATLQAAIDASGINDDLVAQAEPVNIDTGKFRFEDTAHFNGETADGIPGWLSQADIFTSIGPILARMH